MKAITDRAGDKLKAMLVEARAPEEQSVRFEILEGAGKLRLDTEQPSDKVFEHEGRKVLLVDPEATVGSVGKTLDYDKGDFCFV